MNFHFLKLWMATNFVWALSLCWCGGVKADLLINPSFELGTFTNRGDGFQLLSVGSTAITGWTVVNDSLAWGTVPNSASGVGQILPLDGMFFLDLQGDGNFGAPYGGVTQTITTVVGQQYHFTFNLGTQQNAGSPATHGPVSVSATAGGTTLPFTFDPGGTNNTQWGEFGFYFNASSTSTPITIIGTSTAGGAYIGLDQLSVTAVPEPSSTSMLLVFSTLLASSRRKHLANPFEQM